MEKKKSSGKNGGFQSMGLPKELLRGVLNMGYKVPTPVQRKTLPVALSGKDLVCMARTGSGKTAAFLIPLLAHLGVNHKANERARAVVLSPTRELAIQTLRFARQMAKYTSLRSALIVGGDGMEDQFEALANAPDLIIATPGRLVHHLEEVPDFSLESVEFVVFDEADRLFEMGFQDQLRTMLLAVPEQRQCVLFSATMPKALVHFARAGLTDPQLVRLDTDTKVSEELRMAFFTVRSRDKAGALLYVLRELLDHDLSVGTVSSQAYANMNKDGSDDDDDDGNSSESDMSDGDEHKNKKEGKGKGKGKGGKGGKGKGGKGAKGGKGDGGNGSKGGKGKGKGKGKGGSSGGGEGSVVAAGGKEPPLTVVFCATRHHCEYLSALLLASGLMCTVIYGTMDQEARRLNLDSFRKREVPIMLVTDLAARGIDIPLLDHVVNYSFPPNPKLFVHRVGRTARQGKRGLAVSLVEPEELPYMVDLHLFLGCKLNSQYTGTTLATPTANDQLALPPTTTSATGGDGDGGTGGAGDGSGAANETEDGVVNKAIGGGGDVCCSYGLDAMTSSMVHFGCFPQATLDAEGGSVIGCARRDSTGALLNLERVCENAMLQYRRTRPDPSSASIRRSKELDTHHTHPLLLHTQLAHMKKKGLLLGGGGGGFGSSTVQGVDAQTAVEYLHSLTSFRPQATIFEVDSKTSRTSKTTGLEVMRGVRQRHRISQGLKGSAVSLQEEVALAKKAFAAKLEQEQEEELEKDKNSSEASAAAASANDDDEEDEKDDDGDGSSDAEDEDDEEEGFGVADADEYECESDEQEDDGSDDDAGGVGGGSVALVGKKRKASDDREDRSAQGVSVPQRSDKNPSSSSEASETAAGAGKRRLSKAERKKRANNTGGGAVENPLLSSSSSLHEQQQEQEQEQERRGMQPRDSDGGSGGGLGSGAFRDPAFFIGYGQATEAEAKAQDDAFDPSRGIMGEQGGSGMEAVVAGRLEEGMLDLTADETKAQYAQQKVHHWDKRKKKYVTMTLSELAESDQRGAKKLRTESGVRTLSKKKDGSTTIADAYAKWQTKTKKTVALGNGSGGGGLGDDGNFAEDFAAGSAADNQAGSREGQGLGFRMPLPKKKQDQHVANVAKKGANLEAHKHVKAELKGAKVIAEERKKKAALTLKNMPKDKRKHVQEKLKQEWKAKVAKKTEEVRINSMLGLNGNQGGTSKSKTKGKKKDGGGGKGGKRGGKGR